MTINERIELADALNEVHARLERARYLAIEMIDNYFDEHEPEEILEIAADFTRQRAFAFLLLEQLIAAENKLPAPAWADCLQCEGVDL